MKKIKRRSRERPIVNSIVRYFHNKHGYPNLAVPNPSNWGPDVLFIQSRRDNLHVVEVEFSAYKGLGRPYKGSGTYQLDRYSGNKKWLALPKNEYEKSSTELKIKCKKRGYGILVVSGNVKLRTFERIQPKYHKGDFLDEYPKVRDKWYKYLKK